MRLAKGILTTTSMFAALASSAFAQEAIEAQADTTGEIVVTAQKRSESIQDVPLAVSALSGETLARSGSTRFEDFALSVPSVSFQNRGSADDKIVMRGISAGLARESQTATTGFYIDDVPISASYTTGGTDLTLFDIARVEVLRGPQGTLYGAGSQGGAIRVITNRANPSRIEAHVEATGGYIADEFAQADLKGMLNLPLVSDRLALRLVGVHQSTDGFVDDPVNGGSGLNDGEISAGRASLAWTPNNVFDATLTAIYQETVYGSGPVVDLDLNHEPLFGDLTHVHYVDEETTSETAIANLVFNYEMPWATLVSSTSVARNTSLSVSDLSRGLGYQLNRIFSITPGGYTGILPGETESTVQEVRLVSASRDPLSWVVGVFYMHNEIVVSRMDRFAPSSVAGALGIIPFDYQTLTTRDTYAIFGEGTYQFTPEWSVVAGLRYSHVPTRFDSRIWGAALGLPSPASIIITSDETTDTDVSPKFELIFEPNDDLLFYGLVAKGFRPGSPNPGLPPSLGVPPTLQQDTLWNYEIGARTSWYDGRLILNAALYYLDWDGIQVVASTAGVPAIPYLGNGGSAVSQGAELELRFRPDEQWAFTLSAAYTDARFAEDNANLRVSDGQRIAYVPEFSGSFAIDYEQPLSPTVDGFVHFDIRGQTGTPIGYATNNRGIETESYTLSNLRLGANFDGGFGVTLFASNLFDERAEYALSSGNLCTTLSSCSVAAPAMLEATIAQPRAVGVTLSQRF